MRALVKWSVLIGAEISISYILMCLLGVDSTIELFMVLFILLFILSIIFLFIASKPEKRQSVKFIVQIFALFFIFFGFIFVTVICCPFLGSNIAKGMTKEKILSLEIGMSKDNVISILGKPVEIIEFKKLDGEFKNENGYRFVYATPGIYGMGFEFDIWLIHDKMYSLSIERNDFGVYSCYKQKCPNLYNPEALDELISYSSKSLLPRFLKVN